ncbi:hypothetical protein C6497_05370 [Candidatus Poribacteria bacterium]|nr:MAG: hypothetical protein C6497_05370 [Candidatus Poribacteria bacterium]
MGNLDNIQKTAQKLIVLCQKEKTTKTDKEKMLQLQSEILSSIERLTECDLCGSISELIVKMTLADVSAQLCKECSIKSIQSGKIQKSTPRKRSSTPKKQNSPSTSNSKPKEIEKPPESPLELHTRIEAQTGIKKTDVKRLHKIFQDIATPMNLDNTITYVKKEVELAKLKVDEKALQKAVELLFAA